MRYNSLSWDREFKIGLFNEFYRVMNELILFKVSKKTGHRYPSESLIDSSNLDVPLTLTVAYIEKIIDAMVSWWVPDDWVFLGYEKKYCRRHPTVKQVNRKRNV